MIPLKNDYLKAWTLVAKCGFCLGLFINTCFESCNVTFVIVSAFPFLLFAHAKCANNPRLNKNRGQIQHKAASRMQQQYLCSSMSTDDCKCLTGKLKEKEKKKRKKAYSITKGVIMKVTLTEHPQIMQGQPSGFQNCQKS